VEALEHHAPERLGGADDVIVDAVGDWLEDCEAATARGASVGVDVDRDVGVRAVDDLRALRDARTDTGVAIAREDDLRALRAQVAGEVLGDVEVELRLGVAADGFGAGGVACLLFAPVPDEVVDVAWICVVAAVCPGSIPTTSPASASEARRAGASLLRLANDQQIVLGDHHAVAVVELAPAACLVLAVDQRGLACQQRLDLAATVDYAGELQQLSEPDGVPLNRYLAGHRLRM
jgi:hypothetical protein